MTIGIDGSATLFAHRSLSDVVSPAQLNFVESLIHDFIERCQKDSEDLFTQLCSLASGPLVTIATGHNPAANSSVLELQGLFEKL